MRVRFWGTRGSLPSPLNGRAVRRKIVNALVKASGRQLDSAEKAEAQARAINASLNKESRK